MMYPFMTLNNNTEITFSSPLPTQSGERVKVYIHGFGLCHFLLVE